MAKFIARLVLNAFSLMLIAYVLPGVMVRDFPLAILAVFVIGLVNALIRPVLALLSLPITILTLGLFSLVVNALMFWLSAYIAPGFRVTGFFSAFWGGLIFTGIAWAMNALIFDKK